MTFRLESCLSLASHELVSEQNSHKVPKYVTKLCLFFRLMNVGQALNGLAGPITMGGAPAVSAVWFPSHQRTTATAVGTFFGMLGTALSFIVGNGVRWKMCVTGECISCILELREIVLSDWTQLDLGMDFLVDNMVFVCDA